MGWTLRIHIIVPDSVPFAENICCSDLYNSNVFPGNCPEIGEVLLAGLWDFHMMSLPKYQLANIKTYNLNNDWSWHSSGLVASLRGRSFRLSIRVNVA